MKSGSLVCIILLVCTQIVYGIAVTPSRYQIDFEPNTNYTFTFMVSRTKIIDVSLDAGDFSPYAFLDDVNPNGSARNVRVHLSLPDKWDKPGKNAIWLAALEIPTFTGNVIGRAQVRVPIFVIVPYPGIYAELDFSVKNANLGEDVQFFVNVRNRGTEEIKQAAAKIHVYDDNSLLQTLEPEAASIAVGKTTSFYASMPTGSMPPGSYTAIANVTYDGKFISAAKSFKIGHLNMIINNYTRIIEQGKINKLDIEVESRWNNRLNNVFAKITINDRTITTANYRFDPWEKKIISGYYDAANLELGEHDIEIILHYNGQVTKIYDKINVIPLTKEEPKVKIVEVPTTELALAPIILMGVIILLLLVVIVFILKTKRLNEKN